MTDRPHCSRPLAATTAGWRQRSSETRSVGAVLGGGGGSIRVATSGLSRRLRRVAPGRGMTVRRAPPTDESLESVFAYLVRR